MKYLHIKINLPLVSCFYLSSVLLILTFFLLPSFFRHAHAATSGNVVAWGSNGLGQLGNGTTGGDYNFPPTQVKNLKNVISVSAGNHSLALKSDQTVWSWGENSLGHLGDGTNTNRYTPVQVKDPSDPSGFIKSVKAVSASHYNSTALKTDGTVWVWGWNPSPNNPSGNSVYPTLVRRLDGQILNNIQDIDVGLLGDSLALKSDGTVWQWMIGFSDVDKRAKQIKGEDGLGLLTNIVNVSTGWNHNLVLKSDGTVRSWGNNYFGQLGDGSTSDESIFPVKVKNLTSIKAVAAGDSFSLALKSDGTVWSWGLNTVGQLGIGTTSDYSQEHNIPKQVKNPTDPSGFLTNIESIFVGGGWSFAIAKDGTVWSWGENSDGFLAHGTRVNSPFPKQASVLKGAVAISLKDTHGLALMPDADTQLDVPLLKQGIFPFNDNNPAWEGLEFDHASRYGGFQCGSTIAQCGCAMTSVAMILRYHGVEKLPDGTSLNPGTFNTWLKNNNGYFRNEGLNPYVAATVAKKAKNRNPDFKYNGIEYSRVGGVNKTQLTNDLRNGWPGVLQQPGHFIVGTGIDGDTFTINDPFYNRTHLTSYNNSFLSLGRYIPSNTDLSYIVLVVDNEIDISLKDSEGSLVGESYLEYHLNDPTTTEEVEATANPSLKVLAYPKPTTDTYMVEVSSQDSGNYQLDTYIIDEDGNNILKTFNGALASNVNNTFSISYDKQSTENSAVNPLITLNKLKLDLATLYEQGLINNLGIFNSLNQSIDQAIKASQFEIEILKDTLVNNSLGAFISKLESQRGNHIGEQAYQILNHQANFLINNL